MTPGQERLASWRSDPRLFVRECLGAVPDAWQNECLEATATRQRIALKASKGPGKSTLLAWIGWWFLLCFPHPKVVATSITAPNLRDNLWTELAKWQGRSELLKSAFRWSAERIVAKQHPETWWASARTWAKDADATAQADALAGIHGDHVLFLIDECGGIPDAIVATAEAGLANADEAAGRIAKLVIAGNPTELSGPLHRACTRERRLWWVKEISGDPDDPNRAPRVSIQWAREQIEKYGRDNPWVLVNVFGQFPPGQSNTLIGANEASAAAQRTLAEHVWASEAKVLGVDVARFGADRIVYFLRQGRVCFRPQVRRNQDTMVTAHQVAYLMRERDPDGVFVDATGNGAGVVDRLRELGNDVVGIESAGSALSMDPKAPKFLNRRAEMWWLMAQWIRTGGCIPDDSELISELTAPTYKFNAGGLLVLESKDDLKKRGMPSPDKADALALTFAAPVVRRPPGSRSGGTRALGAADYTPFAGRS